MKTVSLILFVVLIGCHPKKQGLEINAGTEELTTLELKGLKISIKVPKGCDVIETKHQFTIVMYPKTRNIRQFTIVELPSSENMKRYPNTVSFDNKARLHYRVFEEPGGNGGTQYLLEGIVKIGDRHYSITAVDQSEIERGNPQFCFKYLATLKDISD